MKRILVPARTILARRDLTVLLVCNVLLGIAYSFVIPFMSMFGTMELHMSPVVFGGFMTVTSLAGIVLSTWLARASDTRFSRKTVLLIGATTGTLGYLGYALVRDLSVLTLIGCFVLGIASVTFSQLFAYARDLLGRSDIESKEVPLYMNVFRLFFALSWTVGPALAAWTMQRHSFRGTFLVAAAFFGLFGLVIAALVPSIPPSTKTIEAAAKVPLSLAFRSPGLLPHFVGFVLFFACSTMGMMNLPLLVLNTLHGNEGQVGIIYSVAPIFELPFMFYVGLLATRGDQGRLIRGALMIAAAYYALLACVGAPWHVYPLQALSAAIVAVTSGVAITFFQNFLPDQPGTATNLYSNANRIGSTSGYLLFGTLSATYGHRAVFVLCACFCLVAVGILVAYRPRAVALEA
jgi:SET family sugar efflux transporter-like MFS transporter